jgi:hypothetical protein
MITFGSGYYSYVWVATGILTVAVPLIFRTMKVKDWKLTQLQYGWEGQYQQQMEQQQYYYQNAGGYYRSKWEQMRQSYDMNECKWWQFGCFRYFTNNDGEVEAGAGWYPIWYSGWAKTDDERQELQELGLSSGSMYFVYVWQILMFLVILGYGYIVLKQDRPLTGLMVALVVYANMCFLAMWWLADGSIITDSEYVQATGFYGQFPVLMFITNAAYVLFGIVHTGLLAWYGEYKKEEAEAAAKEEEPKEHPTFYGDMKTPKKVSVTESGWTVVE